MAEPLDHIEIVSRLEGCIHDKERRIAELEAEVARADDWSGVLASHKKKLWDDLDHARALLDQRDERIAKMQVALERIKIRVHNLVEYGAELCAWVDEALERQT